jgi:hypothetical protein
LESLFRCTTTSTRRRTYALYSGDEAQIAIEPIHVLRGELPPRALSLVIEWAALHQRELMDNWRLARQDQKPRKIEPLR